MHEVGGRASSGAVILVTAVGAAKGSRAAAAALACAASAADRAALLIDVGAGRVPRPSLLATTSARALEERLAAHLPRPGVASRGQFCELALAADPDALDEIAAALPVVRDSVAVVHLPPGLLQATLCEARIRATGALLRADIAADRALTALAAGDLIERGLRVVVLKRPPAWLAARRALLGVSPGGTLPARLRDRLLETDRLRDLPRARSRRP